MTPGCPEEYRQSANLRLRKFREDFGVREAPVDCFRLLRELNDSGRIRIKWFRVDGLPEGFDAVTFFFPGEQFYLIYCRFAPLNWKRSSSLRRINFTVAHELGHIFCGHLQVPDALKANETRALEDAEADAFAAGLLMPEEALLTFRSVREAAEALWVSESAVRRRMRDAGLLFALRTCPSCGFDRIPPAADWCRMCGACLQKTPHPPEERALRYFPPPPKECPVCGARETGAPEGRCMNCDYPKRNHCLPEYDQPQHYCPADAKFCEVCGARTLYSELI